MANGTNGAGVVVGQDLDGWAVTWRGTTPARLPRPACSATSTANAGNASGHAVGLYDDCSGYGAALWRDGQFVRLPSLRDGAEAFDIKAAGDAVGISTCYTCEIATLWRQGVPVDLNSHVASTWGGSSSAPTPSPTTARSRGRSGSGNGPRPSCCDRPLPSSRPSRVVARRT